MDKKPFTFKFFLPEKGGVWLELNCPDRSCLDADGKITLPTQESEGKGIFLKLFCPEGQCEITESTDVP